MKPILKTTIVISCICGVLFAISKSDLNVKKSSITNNNGAIKEAFTKEKPASKLSDGFWTGNRFEFNN